jgi:hypothetical protein
MNHGFWLMIECRKRILLRNEAQLNCVFASFPLRLCCAERLSRVEMNALEGALDRLSARRKKCSHFCLTTPTLL